MGKLNNSEEINQSADNIEVWEDLVSIKDLVISLLVCSFTTLAAYFIAPNEPPKPLFYGLVGALIGFAICSFVVKPKRIIQEEESEGN
ncbi:hypothetical protein GH741_17465 [Aquibacillus halophilus]|uniref:Heme ABC transporter n=1 Tax=Aquibacillus halophilus TaxID=930132 RepID=A0A6A8DFF0_9BACI|nr:hypothetical protein [Aquibacillus halophilus]MRH44435.1 hypothetical protein [Aquibacillus halophilus]